MALHLCWRATVAGVLAVFAGCGGTVVTGSGGAAGTAGVGGSSASSMVSGGSNPGITVLVVGDACNEDYECDSDTCYAGVCGAPPDGEIIIGGACAAGVVCVADATCLDGVCVDNGTGPDCGAIGEPCDVSSDCCGGGSCSDAMCSGG